VKYDTGDMMWMYSAGSGQDSDAGSLWIQ